MGMNIKVSWRHLLHSNYATAPAEAHVVNSNSFIAHHTPHHVQEAIKVSKEFFGSTI